MANILGAFTMLTPEQLEYGDNQDRLSVFRNPKSSITIRSSYNLKKEFSSCIEKRSQSDS